MYKCITISRNAFNNMKSVLSSKIISINTRIRCYIWSLLLYGAETWTITKTVTKRIDAFEVWTYRQMLSISWKEHMMKTSLKLMKIIKKRKCEYFGHIIRRPNSIQRLLLEGTNRQEKRKGDRQEQCGWTISRTG